MVIKSLTITEDAYQALKMLKHGDESFSEVILRMSQKKIGLAAKYFGVLSKNQPEALAFQQRIFQRRKEIEAEFSHRHKKLKMMFT